MFDRGTTNVDVNPPLREALARVGARDALHLGVGADELTVTTLDGAVVEKKVPLPERWLRGFAEVQVIAAGMDLRAELPGMSAVRFLRSLPKRAGADLWVVPAGRELRVTDRPRAGAVCLSGVGRLATLMPLLRFAKSLQVYGPADPTGPASSAWTLELPGMRYTLALSPERWRGFSGEGAVLADLATDEAEADAEVVGMLLNFEPEVELGLLADRANLPVERVRAALTQLGTAGRVGYDLAEAAHFHRELPYDAEHVKHLNPRLTAARRLVEGGAVRLAGDRAEVRTDGGVRTVGLADGSCTCEWWWDHRGSRGPCKHVLAARIVARATAETSAADADAVEANT
ncbi:SWIM zinc finger family protein [Thermopolyspora sp. NPDC052614]|uniref:SWIM zinc finger family protein n=1 Tax=Thermopolyspora sp. NPDC052614 TaxID=3155682 RepID=UPI0034256E20